MAPGKPLRLALATAADAEAVLALYGAQLGYGTCDWDETYPTMETIRFDLAVQGLFIYRETGVLTGAVSLTPEDDLDALPLWTPAHTACIARLCVAPARQGQGLAGRILAALEPIARGRGYGGFRLLCARANPAAARLYAREGYALRGNCHLYDTDFYCYEKLFKD